MRNFMFKFLGSAAILSLAALPALANPVNLTLNGSGSIGFSSTGSGNLTLCLGGGSPCSNSLSANGVGTGDFSAITGFTISGGPISLTEIGSTCAFTNASLSGVTLAGGSLVADLSSMTVSQSSSQVTSGLASITGSGTITSFLGLSVTVPFNFSGALNVGAGVDLCPLPSTGVTGSFAPTPEPGTLLLAASGFLLLGAGFRRWLCP